MIRGSKRAQKYNFSKKEGIELQKKKQQKNQANSEKITNFISVFNRALYENNIVINSFLQKTILSKMQ